MLLTYFTINFCGDFLGYHSVKSVRIWSFSGLYFPAFGLNTGKYGPEKLWTRTLFKQCMKYTGFCLQLGRDADDYHILTFSEEHSKYEEYVLSALKKLLHMATKRNCSQIKRCYKVIIWTLLETNMANLN